MIPKHDSSADPADREVFITRVFDAPRELVFKAWTDPVHLARWFAPHGCAITFREIEIREGGSFHSCIHVPEGQDCWCRGDYREIVAPERLVFTMALADEQGNPAEPEEVHKDPDWPQETVVTVTFSEQDGKTLLTLHQSVSETVAKRTGAYPSWLQMLDRLAGELAQA